MNHHPLMPGSSGFHMFRKQGMRSLFTLLFLLCLLKSNAQQDTAGIRNRKQAYLFTGIAGAYSLSVFGMNELWYKDYPRSSFHWVNDSREWLQMDKTGHFLSSWVAARFLADGLEWTGMSHRSSVCWASGIALAGISTIEVFDGFSAGWGASASDLAFNTAGVALFALQELGWNREKIIPKISWHPTSYATFRPEILGRTLPERMMKDYNGHTLWLSASIRELTGIRLPGWLCLSAGYGAEGMITGYDDPGFLPYFKRYRQFYFSLDADLSRFHTPWKPVNKILYCLNFIKVPFPALVFTRNGVGFEGMYF